MDFLDHFMRKMRGKFLFLNSLQFKNKFFQVSYLKVDQIDVFANEKFNRVNVTLDNSDPEKTLINYFSQLTTKKDLLRMKVGN